MNKTGIIFIAGIFLLMLFCIRCKNDHSSTESDQTHLLKLDTIRDQYNAKKEQKEWTVITKGEVQITVKMDGIVIDHIPEEGPAHVTYFLQGASNDSNLKSKSIAKAEVLYLVRNLIVHVPNEKKAMLFTVSDPIIPKYLEGFNNVLQFTGFGLMARKTEQGGLDENVPYCLCKSLGSSSDDCNIGGDGGAHGCANGTPDGSCQVSCSEIAFACCDMQIR